MPHYRRLPGSGPMIAVVLPALLVGACISGCSDGTSASQTKPTVVQTIDDAGTAPTSTKQESPLPDEEARKSARPFDHVSSVIPFASRVSYPVVDEEILWVSDQEQGNVVAVGRLSRQIVDTIPVGESPLQPAIDSDSDMVWVETDTEIVAIDRTTRQVIERVEVGWGGPFVLDAEADMLWGCTLEDAMLVVDGERRAVAATFPVYGGCGRPRIDVEEDVVYVVNEHSGTLTVFDRSSLEVVDMIEVGSEPSEAIRIHEGVIYVTNYGDETVSVIDRRTRQVIHTIPSAAYPQVDEGVGRVYVEDPRDGTTKVLDSDSYEVVGILPVTGEWTYGPVVDLESDLLWFSSGSLEPLSGKVLAFSRSSLESLGSYEIGIGVSSVFVHPGVGVVYAVDDDVDEIAVIDAVTVDVVDRISVGVDPSALIVDEDEAVGWLLCGDGIYVLDGS